MATIAQLSVSINARIGKFTKNMRKVSTQVKQVASRIAKIGSVAALAAAAGLAVLTKKAFATIDAIAKLSDRLNISTEAIAGLQQGAEITGASAETMSKSLEQLTKRIGETLAGTGEATEALELLGLSAEELSVIPLDEAMKRIADRFKELPTATQKADTANALFGRSGLKLINLLNLGSKGIEEFRAEAELFGRTIGRVDSAKVEAANDAFTRLGTLITSSAKKLAVQLAPFVEALAKKLINVGLAANKAGVSGSAAFGFILKGVAKVTDFIELLKAGWFTLQGVVNVAAIGIVGTIGRIIKGMNSLLELLGIDAARDAANFFSILENEIGNAADTAFKKAGEAFDAFTDKKNSRKVTKFIKEIQDAATKIAQDTVAALPKVVITKGELDKVTAKVAKAVSTGIQTRTIDAKQINLSRFAVGGLSNRQNKPQKIESKQIEQTNILLKQVVENTFGPSLAVLSA